MKYLLDTNAIADYLNSVEPTVTTIKQALEIGEGLLLCQPVHYEVLRGLYRVNATRKLRVYEKTFVPQLEWVDLTDADWLQAARYWATATSSGRQFADMDLLIAAIATRLDAVLVTADDDFDALSVRRENWRET